MDVVAGFNIYNTINYNGTNYSDIALTIKASDINRVPTTSFSKGVNGATCSIHLLSSLLFDYDISFELSYTYVDGADITRIGTVNSNVIIYKYVNKPFIINSERLLLSGINNVRATITLNNLPIKDYLLCIVPTDLSITNGGVIPDLPNSTPVKLLYQFDDLQETNNPVTTSSLSLTQYWDTNTQPQVKLSIPVDTDVNRLFLVVTNDLGIGFRSE
jgi:hypothetical protein